MVVCRARKILLLSPERQQEIFYTVLSIISLVLTLSFCDYIPKGRTAVLKVWKMWVKNPPFFAKAKISNIFFQISSENVKTIQHAQKINS